MEKFTPREWQDALISTVSKNLEERNKIAIEAPTGSGKTSFILYLAFLTGKKLIYLTRTHNEFTRLYEDNQKYFNIPALYLFGKSKLCPLKERWYDSEDDGQKNVCKGCPLKDKTIKLDLKNIGSPENFLVDMAEDSTELIRQDIESKAMGRDTKGNLVTIKKENIKSYCPYYSVRSNMADAQIIAMTYNYLLNPSIRFNVFHGTEGEEMINLDDYYLIFDEAHNLDSVIEDFGRSLQIKTVEKAIDLLVKDFPMEHYNSYERVEANLILENLLSNMSSTRATDNLKSFKFSSDFASRIANLESLEVFSDEFDKKNENRPLKKRSRNYLENVYNFLYDYQRMENGSIYSSVNNPEKKEIKLKLMYYNTSGYLSFLSNNPVIFMSGTMPSEDHISKVWNMEDVLYLKIDSIFKNAGGLKKYNVVTGYTTLGRYRENLEQWSSMLKKYMQYAVDVYAESEKSVLVAVPSYRILFGDSYTRVPGIGNYLPESMRANCIFENRKISYSYIEKRAREEKIIIFSVHGGKLLEGIQLVSHGKSLISDVIIAGLPLIPLDDYRKDKIKYLEKVLKKNAYNLLYYEFALIKVKQAAGRSTRSPDDRSNIWLCDDRFDEPFWRANLISTGK
ncbi:ATP-dependent DNA helicase [Ferroplasma sp.]|uniref:helicase C-terminal domain-containing protein n=2 Tax=Ferroplasma TaxID=74968 RepID=UPI00260C2A46|nr:ATP-dependent DNA helicase [Ferroplasma sp.]